MDVQVGARTYKVESRGDEVTVDGTTFRTRVTGEGRSRTTFVDEKPYRVILLPPDESKDYREVNVDGQLFAVRMKGAMRSNPRPRAQATRTAPQGDIPGGVVAQMTGRVIRIDVSAGQPVVEGDILLTLEAMKMENEIRAPQNGVVRKVAVAAGDRVSEGDLLCVIEAGGE